MELLLWRGALVQLPQFPLGPWDVETEIGTEENETKPCDENPLKSTHLNSGLIPRSFCCRSCKLRVILLKAAS
ncbi:hypothetical protein E2320_001185 [Naja naja]|nr:hypothetical protein E2320_001185 [Naja naja]